jgi:release factor glutamine methyltransferase
VPEHVTTEDVTWRRLVAEAEARFAGAGLPSPAVDARRVVEQASGWEGVEVALHLDEHPTVRSLVAYERMVDRRAAGTPLQYVLGRWGFRSLDLYVDERVLIPRPETEQVVEAALGEARRLRPPTQLRAVDLGTGSGAIACSLAAELVGAAVWGVDRSADALAVARANLAGLGRAATRVTLLEGSWFDPLPVELRGEIDLVVANPPYVAADEVLPSEVADWEPHEALVAGPTGLEDLEAIVDAAPRWLRRPGALVVELAPHQAGAVAARAEAAGFDEVEVVPDLAGRQRALVARRHAR